MFKTVKILHINIANNTEIKHTNYKLALYNLYMYKTHNKHYQTINSLKHCVSQHNQN